MQKEFYLSGGTNLTLHEVNKAAEIISQAANPEADIIFGAVIDKEMEDGIKITVIAAGFDAAEGKREVQEIVGEKLNQEKIDYNDLEIPTFLREKNKNGV